MRFLAVEDEAGREGTPELAQVLHSAPATLIATDFERTFAGDPDLDVVAFFQFKCLDDGGGQANG
jgi:hypothetical protein